MILQADAMTMPLADNSVDAVVCDPPYGLEFMGQEWDKLGIENAWRAGGGFSKPGIGERKIKWVAWGRGDSANATCSKCGGRMRGAKKCECEEPDWLVKGERLHPLDAVRARNIAMQTWHHAWALEALRVLKPGGHLLAFGGTRTHHRLMCGMEDAGFEIRDSIGWNHLEPIFCRCDTLPYGHGIQSQDLCGVQKGMDTDDTVSGRQESGVLDGVLPSAPHVSTKEGASGVEVSDVRDAVPPTQVSPSKERQGLLLEVVPEQYVCGSVPSNCQDGAGGVDSAKPGVLPHEDERFAQSGLERRSDAETTEGELFGRSLCPSTGMGTTDGARGRLHNGASARDGGVVRETSDEGGSCEPYRSQTESQPADEPRTLAVEWIPQGGGAWPGCPRCGKPLAPPLFQGPLAWNYGSGFPKSLDVSKAIDKAAGAERTEVVGKRHRNVKPFDDESGWNPNNTTGDFEYKSPATDAARLWHGYGTSLKPAWEPIILARKPLDGTVAENVLKWGTGALNIDGCRIETDGRPLREIDPKPEANGSVYAGRQNPGHGFDGGSKAIGTTLLGRWPANVLLAHTNECELLGTRQVKPLEGHRPNPVATQADGQIRFTEKPAGFQKVSYSDADGLETVEDWRCAPDCPVRLLDEESGELVSGDITTLNRHTDKFRSTFGKFQGNRLEGGRPSNSGGASRFFYTAKADRAERNIGMGAKGRNDHPTVKPIDLMIWLCRLVTPPRGVILDPFMGSGTTGIAALRCGFRFVGFDKDRKWVEVAERRVVGDAPLLNRPKEI